MVSADNDPRRSIVVGGSESDANERDDAPPEVVEERLEDLGYA